MSLLLFFSMIAQALIPPLPAEALVIFYSLQMNIWEVTFFAGSGLFVGSLLCSLLGRLSIPLFVRIFTQERINRVQRLLKKHGEMILWVRILPYNPSDIISYASGAMDISVKKLILMTATTSYVRCFLLASLGSRIQGIWSFALIAGILFISFALSAQLLQNRNGIQFTRVLASPRLVWTILTHPITLDPLTILCNSKAYILFEQRMVCFCTIKNWGKYKELGTVYTFPANRKKGFMKKLLSKVLKKRVFVLCDQSLEPFYQKFGFARIRNPPWWFRFRVNIFNLLLRPFVGYTLIVMIKENRS